METNPVEMVNLTPHVVRFLDPDSARFTNVTAKPLLVLPTSGAIARANFKERRLGKVLVHGDLVLNIIKTDFGRVINLPPERDGTIYIVSRLVVELAGHLRSDIFFVSGLKRDPKTGKVVGGTGLARV